MSPVGKRVRPVVPVNRSPPARSLEGDHGGVSPAIDRCGHDQIKRRYSTGITRFLSRQEGDQGSRALKAPADRSRLVGPLGRETPRRHDAVVRSDAVAHRRIVRHEGQRSASGVVERDHLCDRITPPWEQPRPICEPRPADPGGNRGQRTRTHGPSCGPAIHAQAHGDREKQAPEQQSFVIQCVRQGKATQGDDTDAKSAARALIAERKCEHDRRADQQRTRGDAWQRCGRRVPRDERKTSRGCDQRSSSRLPRCHGPEARRDRQNGRDQQTHQSGEEDAETPHFRSSSGDADNHDHAHALSGQHDRPGKDGIAESNRCAENDGGSFPSPAVRYGDSQQSTEQRHDQKRRQGVPRCSERQDDVRGPEHRRERRGPTGAPIRDRSQSPRDREQSTEPERDRRHANQRKR